MSVREIRVFGDPVLRSKCDEARLDDPALAGLVTDLLDTVQIPGRAGVAAPQIGVGVRAFSYLVENRLGYVLNPRLVETRGELEPIDEGCLSVPDLGFLTPRYPWARVEGIDLDGNRVELEGEGLFAQMLQHECAHLDGRLYIMELDKPTRMRAMEAIRNAPWF
ncbi:MAG TPA: peptide deformylase [Candidatus Agrococcus pullicola]|uniref:Peptide deformylase n=1 Tax=Candidatus Agrococcus pullicola TaxID=2838429 RepID=A0A9D1YXJ0_9MICO|nr:peptide deformylase [Candidatus Agrococcus pullicola]